jgi:hypothetical protein
MNKNFLPSTQFVARLIILCILVGGSFGLYKGVSYLRTKYPSKKGDTLVVKRTIIQKDSNNNTIPDWEESLWGLDPLKNGDENRQFILAKRAIISRESGTGAQDTPLSENETVSREFFAVIMSLQQSGDLNEASMQSVARTLGEKIVASTPKDIYSAQNLPKSGQGRQSEKEYYIALQKILAESSKTDIGKELSFLAAALQNSDSGAVALVGTIGESYRTIGSELMQIQTPQTKAVDHVRLANDYEHVAVAIQDLTQILENPILGMRGTIEYKTSTDRLAEDLQKMSDIFKSTWYTKQN